MSNSGRTLAFAAEFLDLARHHAGSAATSSRELRAELGKGAPSGSTRCWPRPRADSANASGAKRYRIVSRKTPALFEGASVKVSD